MEITKDIKYVGVNDHRVDLFEGQYVVPNGMAYNSYVIMDEKVAVMDTVDANFKDEWLANIKKVLGDREPDYIVIQHQGQEFRLNASQSFCYPTHQEISLLRIVNNREVGV